MSLDRSLRTSGSLARHRNVLTRAERLIRLADEGKWEDGNSVFGLTKTANRKAKIGGKTKKKAAAADADAAGEGAEAATEEKKA